MIFYCFSLKALGIAVETKRMDMFRDAILKSSDRDGMLSYANRVAMTLINQRYEQFFINFINISLKETISIF